MNRFSASIYSAILCIFLLALSGCAPAENPTVNEEQDPHFQRGRSLTQGQDYSGAIEEYKRAIENNPRAAAAHFELACIYEGKLKDYAAAIYHYREHLALQPKSTHATQALDRIKVCKRELANVEYPLPATQNLQKEVDRLTVENVTLKQQNEALKSNIESNITALASARSEAQANAAALAQARALSALPGQPASARSISGGAVPVTALPTLNRARVYTIKPNDTIASISQQYGIKITAILTANPKVNPKKLKVGQAINLP